MPKIPLLAKLALFLTIHSSFLNSAELLVSIHDGSGFCRHTELQALQRSYLKPSWLPMWGLAERQSSRTQQGGKQQSPPPSYYFKVHTVITALPKISSVKTWAIMERPWMVSGPETKTFLLICSAGKRGSLEFQSLLWASLTYLSEMHLI